jgi:hypothetical protein
MKGDFLDNESDTVSSHRPVALTCTKISVPEIAATILVYTPWNGLKVYEDSDSMTVTFLNETFQDIPAVDIHLRWFSSKICASTEDRPKGKKTYWYTY